MLLLLKRSCVLQSPSQLAVRLVYKMMSKEYNTPHACNFVHLNRVVAG
jgi:hypothetical protein